ncbi:MAG: triose-phosphate isomerase [Lachnospiraceae bacterium]|nr:triose-phosphate isomerase [Lachnospiraceae bacterium]MDY5498302.1 triose-phosphate isomerase [Anaerobutyricum sp.]
MKKKFYFGTNTKMYKTIQNTVDFILRLQELTSDISRDEIELFVIPSFTTQKDANQVKKPELMKVGAQNMGWEEEGQFTGEISPIMLQECGTDLVMIGHSERRHVLGESDEEENKKVLCALNHDFTTLLCVGETGEEKEYGISEEVIRIQLKKGLYGVTREQTEKLWIAYEPVWAIGVNGKPASKEYAEEIHRVMRETLIELFGETAGNRIPLLYGGSVNPGNAVGLSRMEHIDGLFIGRAAWDADNFNEIIRSVLEKR